MRAGRSAARAAAGGMQGAAGVTPLESRQVNRVALGFINTVDRLSAVLGKVAAWLILFAVLVSAVNAMVRYAFSIGSNAWLELQWYMFGATVYLGAPIILKLNEHVRVDIVYGGRSGRTKAWIDLLGFIFFFMPVCLAMVWLSVRLTQDWSEMSTSAGGLIRWPAKILIPIGFALLALQGVSEILKRIGFLRGTYNMDTHYERPRQ